MLAVLGGTSVARAAALDRPALAATACGDAASLGAAAETVIAQAAELPSADLAWAAPVMRAILERRLVCVGQAAFVTDRPGAAEGRDAVSGAAQPMAGGRAPVLGLRQRALAETAEGILALLTAPEIEARARGLKAIERRIGTLPDGIDRKSVV